MIYQKLLETHDHQLWGGLWLQQQESIIVESQNRRLAGIDVAILRTCRLAWIEASAILYESNWITFSTASQINDFRFKYLRRVIVGQNSDQSQKLETVFFFGSTPYGRLSRIHTLSLIFYLPCQNHRAYQKNSVLKEAWSDLLFPDRQGNGNEECSFPALKNLGLEFEGLRLGYTNNGEEIAVCDSLKLADQLVSTWLRLIVAR